MDSFYGGRKGQDFTISLADKATGRVAFNNKAELVSDLKKRWQSDIGVGDYVIISYGMVSDGESYSDKLQDDLDLYGKSYNSTLWQKIYTEQKLAQGIEAIFLPGADKGIGYRLITSMTGNTPKFIEDVTVNKKYPNDPPKASIQSKNVDAPELILELPQAQFMTVQKDDVDVNTTPTLTWDDEFPDPDEPTIIHKKVNPILTLHLPVAQKIEFLDPVFEDADFGKRGNAADKLAVWDDTDDATKVPGDLTNKVNRPTLQFHLPQSQIISPSHVTVERKDVDENPEAEIVTTGTWPGGEKKINSPEVIFRLPVAQKIDWQGLLQTLDAGEPPEIVWDDQDITSEPGGSTSNTRNRPTLGFKLPRTAEFKAEHVSINYVDVGTSPTVALDVTGQWPNGVLKKNEPGIIFTLPLSQKINYLGVVTKDADYGTHAGDLFVEWNDADDPTKGPGDQDDTKNTPTLKFNLPRRQILQAPTLKSIGPSETMTVADIGTVNEPKYEFSLQRAAVFSAIDEPNEKSKTYFTKSLPDARLDNLEVGDYVINSATGFLYKVTGKVINSTITCQYLTRLSMYVPSVGYTYDTAFTNTSGTWKRREISVSKSFLDTEQTQVQLDFKIPNQANIEIETTEEAPLNTVTGAVAAIKDANTIKYTIKVPRGTRWYDNANSSALKGDWYLDSSTGDIYAFDGASWNKTGNIQGPVGDSLNVVATYTYDNITHGGADTLANVSTLLEKSLRDDAGLTASDPVPYPDPDELIKVTWRQRNVSNYATENETSYWYFYIAGRGWDRAQITAGLGDIIVNSYSSTNEDNKVYSINYINKLIDDTATTDKNRKTYSIQKIDAMTSWSDLDTGISTLADFYKTKNNLPISLSEGRIYLVSARDSVTGAELGNNLFVDISDSERVQISAAKLSKRIPSGGSYTYIVVEPEDIVTKSGIVGLSQNAVLVGDATGGVTTVPNAVGAFCSDGLTKPEFKTLPLSMGGTNATTAADARTNLDVYSTEEVDDKDEELDDKIDTEVARLEGLIGKATTQTFTNLTIPGNGWQLNGTMYENVVAVSGLTCGKDGQTPPTVICTSNDDDYQEILKAIADVNQIVFKTDVVIENDIGIIVIDAK